MHEQLLVLLITGHLLGDFVFQTSRDVQEKKVLRWQPFLRHVLLHAALAYLLLGAWTLWQIPLLLALTHAPVDLAKAVFERRLSLSAAPRPGWRLLALALDQLLHLAVLFLLARWAAILRAPDAFTWLDLFEDKLLAVSVILAGLVVTVHLGAVVVGILIEPYLLQLEQPAPPGAPPEPRGFIGGGRVIGQLERALVFLLVTTGNLGGVGFLAAAKSIFRFGELKDHQQRKEAEYILIGTLMSFTWSMFGAWITVQALEWLPAVVQ